MLRALERHKVLTISTVHLFIIAGTVATLLSFILESKIVFFLLGIINLCIFIKYIYHSPVYIVSITLLAAHPFSYTLAKTGIPLISPCVIILLNLFALIILIRRGKGLYLPGYLSRYLGGLSVFLLLVFAKLAQGGFSAIGMDIFIYFLGFGFIASVLTLFTMSRTYDIQRLIMFTLRYYAIYAIAVVGFIMLKAGNLEEISKLENTIGISYFATLGLAMSIFSKMDDRWYRLFLTCISLFIVIMCGQRSFLIGYFILIIMWGLFKSHSKIILIRRIIVSILVFLACLFVISKSENSKIRQMQQFASAPTEYIDEVRSAKNIIESYSATGTIGNRIFLWFSAIETANPIYGNGLGDFASFINEEGMSYPHNILIETYELFGCGGLILLLVYLFSSAKRSLIIIQHNNYYSIFAFANIVLLFVLQFSSSIFGLFCGYIAFDICNYIALSRNQRNLAIQAT